MYTLDDKTVTDLREFFNFSDVRINNTQYLIQCLLFRYPKIYKVEICICDSSLYLVTYDKFGCVFFHELKNIIERADLSIELSLEMIYESYESALIKEAMR